MAALGARLGVRDRGGLCAWLALLVGAGLSVLPARAQQVTSTCKDWSLHDVPAGNAVITAKAKDVPPMRIRVMDAGTGFPLQTSALRVEYVWQWLQYPSTEHMFGGWTDAEERLSCEKNKEGWIETPAHSVQPRGWYTGRYTRLPWPRGPEFTGVVVAVETPAGGSWRIPLKPRELSHFATADLVIAVSPQVEPEREWQSKPDRP